MGMIGMKTACEQTTDETPGSHVYLNDAENSNKTKKNHKILEFRSPKESLEEYLQKILHGL